MNTFKVARTALLALVLGSPVLLAGHEPGTARKNRDRDSYVFMHGNQWMSTNIDLSEMRELRRVGSGDLLWFRRGGKEYVIQDKVLLQEAKGLFAPLRALDPEREEIHRRERALDRQEEELDREEEEIDRIQDRLSDDDDEDGEDPPRLVSDEELRDLERRSRELEDRKRPLREEQRKIEELERAFDRKEDALEKKAEAELWKLIDHALATGVARPN
jgi:DNA repair exonuclease SbcCD ATPase subunit